MTWLQTTRSRYAAVGLGSGLLGFLIAWPVAGTAQDKKDTAPPAPLTQPADGKDLAEQVRQLTAKIARLEAAVAKIAPPAGMSGMGGAGGGMMMDNMMGGMGGKKMGGGGMGGMMMGGGGMGGMMMDNMMGGMGGGSGGGVGGMAGGSGGGMGMMDDDMDMMGMMGMGSMGGPKGMKMKKAAALPGFPGASHLYHIGATGFFLDHPEHITLSTEQKARLGQAKQKATTDKASAQRRIDEAEQQLWELTGADQPDVGKIDPKVREIEKLRGDQRLAFIRSVGEAARVLTDDQRSILLGLSPPAPAAPHVHPKAP